MNSNTIYHHLLFSLQGSRLNSGIRDKFSLFYKLHYSILYL